MDVHTSRSSVVKSISQRWLLNKWNQLRGRNPLPAWNMLPRDEVEGQIDTLMFCDVLHGASEARFRISTLGARIAASYGGDKRGQFLDEVLPPVWRDGALESYRVATASRLPFYNVVDTGDRDGCVVHMERLLLPFTEAGMLVEHMLVSIETLSVQARFRQEGLANSPFATGNCTFNATIDFQAPAPAK